MGLFLANAADKYDIQHLLLYSSAIFLGILCWDVTMAIVSSSFRRFLTKPILVLISGFIWVIPYMLWRLFCRSSR